MAKILTFDLETAPHLAWCWGLWNQNINPAMMQRSSEVLCWSAKWVGDRRIHSAGGPGLRDPKRRRVGLLEPLHALMTQADVVVGYNSDRFDLRHINREFLMAGLEPTTAYISVDLLKVVRRRFKLPSNRLGEACRALGLGDKADTGGWELWAKCIEGDPAAWKKMLKYNAQDVRLTERLFERLLPWIPKTRRLAALLDGD